MVTQLRERTVPPAVYSDITANISKFSDISPYAEIDEVYEYQDETGNPCYYCVKLRDYRDGKWEKTFRRCRFDDDGNLIPKIAGLRLYPYRLPQLIWALAEGKTIYFTEGEKDADSLAVLSLTATTVIGGANARVDYLKDWFIGDPEEIVIFADNDDAGEKFAQRVANLFFGLHFKVKIVRFPELSKGGGVSDYLSKGGTTDSLNERVGQTPYYISSPPEPSVPEAITRGRGRLTSKDYLITLARLEYTFKLNELTGDCEINGELKNDELLSKIFVEMYDLGFTNKSLLEDIIMAEAQKHKYNPNKEYLEGLTWDGQDHIAQLSTFFKDDSSLFQLYIRRWLVGAVARIYQETYNPMLVLQGVQRAGKSYFAKWLCNPLPRYFYESPIIPDNRDHLLRLWSTWVWEVAELGATTRRQDREALKHFISQCTVRNRKMNAKHDLIKPAVASFIGTVNPEGGFLNDPTGRVRFNPVSLTAIDWSYSKEVNVSQLWAQAKALYDRGEPWQLTASELATADRDKERFQVENPLKEIILKLFIVDPGNESMLMTAKEIIDEIGDRYKYHDPRAMAMQIAQVLTSVGLKKRPISIKGTQLNRWIGIRTKDQF